MPTDAHLIVKSFSTDAAFRAFVLAASAETAKAEGLTYLSKRMHEVAVLEPGSPACHLWAASFSSTAARDSVWSKLKASGAADSLKADLDPVVLAIAGLPSEGLPDPAIPTVANVTPPPSMAPRGYMLIEGSVSDQPRVDGYRDVILPMIAGLGAYYTVFELGANLQVLSGEWNDAIFAISRWPNLCAAHAFWFSDRYQSVAIPKRIGAGRFSVLLDDGVAG